MMVYREEAKFLVSSFTVLFLDFFITIALLMAVGVEEDLNATCIHFLPPLLLLVLSISSQRQ